MNSNKFKDELFTDEFIKNVCVAAYQEEPADDYEYSDEFKSKMQELISNGPTANSHKARPLEKMKPLKMCIAAAMALVIFGATSFSLSTVADADLDPSPEYEFAFTPYIMQLVFPRNIDYFSTEIEAPTVNYMPSGFVLEENEFLLPPGYGAGYDYFRNNREDYIFVNRYPCYGEIDIADLGEFEKIEIRGKEGYHVHVPDRDGYGDDTHVIFWIEKSTVLDVTGNGVSVEELIKIAESLEISDFK